MSATRRKTTTTLVGVSVTAAIAGCTATGTDGGSGEGSPTSPSAPRSVSSSGAASSGFPSRSGSYDDGEYVVDGEYGTRGSSIGVTITLEGDRITAVDVAPHATDETSRTLQKRFADEVPALVVGKDIDDVDLDRVAGNSHTPDGFDDALEKIKADASG
ncbi:hypothetical protein [Streptomyces ziwulingensis]|uniref:FMN-binding domain-containing protein n=1 Tax=Streptomyces ziwulingensis TaxID=1045501 RepID=A0ABP9BPB7_9ACTN